MKRETGYYWVVKENVWQVGQWTDAWSTTGPYWIFTGNESRFDDDEVGEIDERKIERLN